MVLNCRKTSLFGSFVQAWTSAMNLKNKNEISAVNLQRNNKISRKNLWIYKKM